LHVFLIGFGSAGDVLPLVGIGRALKARGHRVSVFANEHFSGAVARAKLEFVQFGSEALYQEGAANPDGAHPIRGFQSLMAVVGDATRPLYDLIKERFVPGETAAVATSLAFGARLAQEKLGLPLATAHMCPLAFRSDHDHVVVPALPELPWAPTSLKRFVGWAGDTFFLDPPLVGTLNAARADLGLGPVRRPCHRWWNSPEQVIGLFPRWFGEPQPDWPTNTRLVGFIRDFMDDEPSLAPEVEAFLAAGERPVVFTPGSANKHGTAFFATAKAVSERLGIRAIFVTQFAEQVPPALPQSILHVRYTPFARLIPRARALVHHGGIGTAVQAMGAGIPQLIVPIGYDQPDNASRLGRLGVARTLRPRAFAPDAATRDVKALLESPDVARACERVAERFRVDTARDEASEVIEGMLARRAPRAAARRDEARG
jgi:UDP:flavonoid glycosyltransferase YjiC (YdhE family)